MFVVREVFKTSSRHTITKKLEKSIRRTPFYLRRVPFPIELCISETIRKLTHPRYVWQCYSQETKCRQVLRQLQVEKAAIISTANINSEELTEQMSFAATTIQLALLLGETRKFTRKTQYSSRNVMTKLRSPFVSAHLQAETSVFILCQQLA